MPPTSRCLLLFILGPLSLLAAMDSCPVRLYWFNISSDLYGVSHTPTTYHTAYNCCSSQASRLRLTVLTPDINSNEVFKAMAKYPLQSFWIDAMKKSGTYFWPDGSSVQSSLWSFLEPSLLDDCARLDISKGGLAGWPCSSSSFNVFCQGHTPKASVRLAKQCSLNFTWMPISDWMYGISTVETDYWTARNCCMTYGPYFRLAVLDEEINVTTTLAYLQQKYISGEFWVDASRPNFDSSQDFVWSNGKPVNSDLWSNTNNWREPSPGDVVAALALNSLTKSPKLFGTTVNASSPSYFALCQEWFSFTGEGLTTLTTALTSPVSEVSTFTTTTSFQSTSTTHTTTEGKLSTVIVDETSVSSISSNEVSKQSYVSEKASPSSLSIQETSTLTLLSQTEETSIWIAYPTTETSTQSATIGGVPFKSCACRCAFNYSLANENLDKKVKEIQLDLMVNKANLSSTRRKRNSQKDNRRSSSTIGVTGVVVVVVLVMIIVFHDLSSLLCTIVTHWKSDKSQRIQPPS